MPVQAQARLGVDLVIDLTEQSHGLLERLIETGRQLLSQNGNRVRMASCRHVEELSGTRRGRQRPGQLGHRSAGMMSVGRAVKLIAEIETGRCRCRHVFPQDTAAFWVIASGAVSWRVSGGASRNSEL